MKRLRLALLPMLAVALSTPAFAQGDWLTRCNHQIAGNNDPETGNYIFQTHGKVAADAKARAYLDYTASGSAHGAVYLTDAKNLMNPYGGASLSVSYFVTGDANAMPQVGQVSFRTTAKDFKPIPGSPVSMKLMLDGVAFGPYQPRGASDGMYSVWLDTDDTDGDSKPPLLKPADFAKLAKAVDVAVTAEVVLVQDGADIVKMPVPIKARTTWRDGLTGWAKDTAKGVSAASTFCLGADRVAN
jgi:hypothetical protein